MSRRMCCGARWIVFCEFIGNKLSVGRIGLVGLDSLEEEGSLKVDIQRITDMQKVLRMS